MKIVHLFVSFDIHNVHVTNKERLFVRTYSTSKQGCVFMFQGMGRGTVIALLNCLLVEVLLISVLFFSKLLLNGKPFTKTSNTS